MDKKKININNILTRVDSSLDSIDGMRLEKLESMKSTQQALKTAYEQEKTRLEAKYGKDHPRVKKLDAKLKFQEGFMKGLDVEIDNASIEVPSFDKNTWMVYGRVLNKNLKGIKGRTVSLYEKEENLIKDIGQTQTNKYGFYSLVYKPETRGLEIPETRELFLTVSDNQNRILHRESEPLFIKIGQIDTRMIVITDKDGNDKPPGPEKDQWVVEGKIKDEKNTPIKGVKVSLYDTKHLFDKRLGSKVANKYGKFKFIFKGDDFKALKEGKADIHLEVVDDRGKAVYTSPEPVKCRPGGLDSYDIQIPLKKE